jgi:hypothetical protein
LILDDKRMVLRTTERPEFLLRLEELLRSYGDADRPGLVVQARPAPEAKLGIVDVDDEAFQRRFLAGSGGHDAWWHGFQSAVGAKPTFHGIASLPMREQFSWVCEVHRDAHFIAGLWRFPELAGPQGKAVPVVADFHAGFFNDFFKVVVSTLEAEGSSLKFETTATLVHADQLCFAGKSDFGNPSVIASPLSVENLQWPITACEVGTPAWMAQAKIMARALAGAYGQKL